MRHNRVLVRPGDRRAFRSVCWSAVLATAAAGGLGYAIAYSPLAGWVAVGVAGAIAMSLWLEARLR